MFVRNELGDLPHERTQNNRERVLSVYYRAAKSTKRENKLFQVHHPHTDAEGPKTTTTPARLLGCFVEWGIYILANSGAGVVSKLGVTTGYALIDFVVVGAHDPQPQRMFTVLKIVLCCFCSQ